MAVIAAEENTIYRRVRRERGEKPRRLGKMTRIFLEIAKRAKVEALGVGMPGPRLPERVRQIVDGASVPPISRCRAACIAMACVAVSAGFFIVTLARAQSSAQRDWEKAAGGKMAFEVASVKRDMADASPNTVHSDIGLDSGGFFTPTGGLFSASNFSLAGYLNFAYKLTRGQVRDLSSELPKWASADRWDVDARANGNPTKDQYRLMMQGLLADRFKLAVHFETRQLPVLALEVEKNSKLGPRLQAHPVGVPCPTDMASNGWPVPTVANGFPKPCGSVMWGPASVPGDFYMGARDVPIAMIASALSFQPATTVDRPVIDETGLAGNFDFTLQFSSATAIQTRAGDVYEPDEEGSAFVGALKDQLGLKLVSTTGPVEVLVIDHVEEPTAN